MAVVLTSPVLGHAVDYVYTGPLEPWLLKEGYARAQASPVDHTNDTGVLPKDDPTLAINREAPNVFKPSDGSYVISTPKLSGGLAAPEVSTVAPNTGGVGGTTVVTISGDNLSDVTGVTFGGTAATGLQIVDDQTIRVTAPAHAAGAVNVVVTDPDGSATKTNGYTYA